MTNAEERRLNAQARNLVTTLNGMIERYRAGETDGKTLRAMVELVCPEAIPDLFPDARVTE